MSQRRQQAVVIGGIVICWVLALFLRAAYQSHQELALAETAAAARDWPQALMHYERAVKWYTPLSPSVRRAVEGLWALGSAAEQRQEWPLALEAYRTLRASLYAVESLYVPYEDWIPRCEEKIAHLMAQIQYPGAAMAEKSAQATARFTAMLQRSQGLHVGWVVLTEVSFFGWVGATILFIWRAFATGTLRWRPGLRWGSGIVVCFTLWIIGLWFV